MSCDIKTTQWRLVEVGRVLLLNEGPYAGKLATIVEIIDHKRVLIDSTGDVPRQSFPLKNVTLTPIVIDSLPRAARTGVVIKLWEKSAVNTKWAESAWAKKIALREKRRDLSDFDRFRVLVLKKQRKYDVRKAAAKAKA